MKSYAELKKISKSFGEVRANKDVSFSVSEGSIHALLGENGAGKSTAMKILYGMLSPDSGVLSVRGRDVYVNGAGKWNSQLAFEQGIGMVHQHFMLAQNETVLDNLVLGVERSVFGFRDRKHERAELETLMGETGLRVPLDVLTENLTVGQQSRCEILKVLYRKANFLILDEPTAVLTPHEIEEFLRTLKHLRDQGRTILIVTHKLKEVMAVADEATVLRAGETVATCKVSETNMAELAELMVGRRVVLPKTRTVQKEKLPSRFESVRGKSSLNLRAGEITGIAGVEGNGQEELVSEILNLYLSKSDAQFESSKLAFIPSDRHHEGLVLKMDLSENLRLTRRFHPAEKSLGILDKNTDDDVALLKTYDVRPALPHLHASSLSGGNQQKLIIAREFSKLPSDGVLIAVHPTRGVDLGAIEFIHGEILKAAERGVAVLLISSELDELMALSHRIGVIYKNEIVKWFDMEESMEKRYDEFRIGEVMLTGHEGGA